MTNYPASIDNQQSLPPIVDNLTPVSGATVNRLRDTIIAVEMALGIRPNGIYNSVAARLIALENGFNSLNVIELNGDLGNTLQYPFVIGLQGRPVSSAQPGLGQALVWDGIAWVPGSPGPPLQVFQILSLNGPATIYEIGQALENPIFNATYNATPTTAFFEDNKGNPAMNVFLAPPPSVPPGTFLYPQGYIAHTAADLPYSVIFTLAAGNGTNASATFTATWGQRIFYGVGTVTAYQSSPASFINGLATNLSATRTTTFTIDAGPSQVIFVAVPTNLGIPDFWVDGFQGGFTASSPITVSITNGYGVTENYSVYQTEQPNLGTTLVYVF